MTETAQKSLIISTLASGSTAELRRLAKNCDDREVGREMYNELLNIAHGLSQKFEFEWGKRIKEKEKSK